MVLNYHKGGDFLSASRDWNEVVRLLKMRMQGGMMPGFELSKPNVHIRNKTGSNLEAFTILGIDGVTYAPTGDTSYPAQFKERVTVDGVAPVAGTHEGLLVVAAEPIPAGDAAIGDGWTLGICVCQVYADSLTPDSCSRADLTDGVTDYLTVSELGEVEILWRDTSAGSGQQWAYVKLGGRTALDHQLMADAADYWTEPVRTIHWGSGVQAVISYPARGTVQIG